MEAVMSPARAALVALSVSLATSAFGCGDDDAQPDDGDDQGTVADASTGDPDGGDGAAPDAGRGKADAAPGDGGGDGGEPDAGGGAPDGGGDPDAGTPPDAGGNDDAGPIDAGTPDGGPLDAGPLDGGGPVDAGPDPLDGQFLLGIRLALAPTAPAVRFITTVDATGASADFTFQAITAANCLDGGGGGFPVGNTESAPGIAIAPNGTFQLTLTTVTLPAEANSVLCSELSAESISVQGTVASPDLTCGTITVNATGLPPLAGTFGAIRIPTGTVGDENLPAPVTSCP